MAGQPFVVACFFAQNVSTQENRAAIYSDPLEMLQTLNSNIKRDNDRRWRFLCRLGPFTSDELAQEALVDVNDIFQKRGKTPCKDDTLVMTDLSQVATKHGVVIAKCFNNQWYPCTTVNHHIVMLQAVFNTDVPIFMKDISALNIRMEKARDMIKKK